MSRYFVAVPVEFDTAVADLDDAAVAGRFAERLGVATETLTVHRIPGRSPLEEEDVKLIAFLTADGCETLAEEVQGESPDAAVTPQAELSLRSNRSASDADSILTFSASKPHELVAASTKAFLNSDRENALLRAEIEDLRAKVAEITAFKNEVLESIKLMKKEVAMIGEDVLLTDAHDDD